MSLFPDLLTPAMRALQRDEVRTSAQTVSAVLLAYGAMQLLQLDTASWAVFSALFVVQANIGGTIDSALWRMAGALAGAVVAVAAMLTIGQSGSPIALLAAGVLVMSAISIHWPSLSYGLVTVTIISVAPDIQFIESSVSKVAAIIVGSCCAILACVAVFPVSAHYSAKVQLASALRMSGKYLMECMSCVADGEAEKTQDMQDEIVDALRKASSMWRQAAAEKPSFVFRKRRHAALPGAVLEQVGHLQQSLALADRFSQAPPSYHLSDEKIDVILSLAKTMKKELDRLGDAVVSRRNHTDTAAVWEHYEHFCATMDEVADGAESPEARDYLMALKWASHSIIVSIDSLARHVDGAQDGQSGSR